MNQDQAIQILTNVARLAQSKGILSLDDAVVVREAIGVFNNPAELVKAPSDVVEETPTK